MEIDENLISQLKKIFVKDYSLNLNDQETKAAAGNLIRFFSLLWEWDQQDKRKLNQMQAKQNGDRI